MKQDAKKAFEEFRLLQRWATLLAHTEATLVAEAGEGCLGLRKIVATDGRPLRVSFDERHERAMAAFRERATKIARTLLPVTKTAKKKKAESDPVEAIFARSTALDAIERLRELFALAHLPTTAELGDLPDDPPWEDT